ncbi:hypothetical protein [Streptomyces marispadix]|uniref:Integral membrane protein n=1 Tax=Streptomyces marispadix TaxID=2922868 RepID=A0ABS9SWE5_9ACTN|nr:hypothetical protein [Streptomyces marispadix]MCH6160594.1 hypothetical protein [Streptomyces marispadix]
MRTEPDAASASASDPASAQAPPHTPASRAPAGQASPLTAVPDRAPGAAPPPTRGFRFQRRTVAAATALALLAAAYLIQLLGLLLAEPALVVAGAALGLATESWILTRRRALARSLGSAQLHHPVRQLLRDGLLLGGLARLDALRPLHQAALLLVAVLGCWATHFICQAVAARVRRSRRLPVVTRNIDVSALRIGPAPAALFGRNGAARLLACSALVTAGASATAVTGDARWAALVAPACWAALLAGTVHLACRLLPGRRPPGEEEVLAWLDGWLAEYRPTVGMYFSGGTASAYQADMWLPVLDKLDGRPLIVLRERFMVQKIDVTDVPIVCIPKVAHLMRLEHSTLEVMLHPANSGKTSHVLRIPTIKHAFINHGESDKLSSCNPYAKAYDEVWVAGPAARERYRLAGIGVRDEDVVEVGRPQLEPVRPYAGPPARGRPVTVLYAPTWEGWTDDPGNTSLPLAGERIVAALLADEGVRLLYKPHPMTGSVDPAVRDVDMRIRQQVAEAAARRRAVRPGRAVRAEHADPGTAAELERLEAELAALDGSFGRRGGDEAERMLRQHPGAQPSAAAVRAAVEAWEECYWRAGDPWEHQVLTTRRPGIHSCFNQADLLVSDVSSVVSDYLSSEKPYAVVNTTGLPEEEFRAGFPTVRAATVLTPEADGIPALLESVREPAEDVLRQARAELKAHLLGPDEPPSAVRFGRAVAALRAQARTHRERWAGAGSPGSGAAPEPPGHSGPDRRPGIRRGSGSGVRPGTGPGAASGQPAAVPGDEGADGADEAEEPDGVL